MQVRRRSGKREFIVIGAGGTPIINTGVKAPKFNKEIRFKPLYEPPN